MSEPQRIREILPDVMKEIESRMELRKSKIASPKPTLFIDGHRAGVFAAVEGFMVSKRASMG